MPFVKNAWYAAAWKHELADGPVGRVLLGEPVVIYQTSDGEVAALRDVCPHRAVPLSLGTVVGDRIRCPYHALEFDPTGVCRHNPHVKGRPDGISTPSFPAVSRYGVVWVWFGDPDKADKAEIPQYEWFEQPDTYAVGHGYTKVDADYRLIMDNLLDLAHAEYLHLDTVGSPGASEVEIAEIVRDGIEVSVNSTYPDLPPSAIFKPVWTQTERVDQYQNMNWRPASNLILDLGIKPPGAEKSEGWHVPSAHILTPETETTTHYFWAFARNFAIDDPAVTEAIIHFGGIAFGQEDKPMIEAAQTTLSRTTARLLNFTIGDRGSALVRKEIDRMIGEEQSTH